jgi:hypothetical protein
MPAPSPRDKTFRADKGERLRRFARDRAAIASSTSSRARFGPAFGTNENGRRRGTPAAVICDRLSQLDQLDQLDQSIA